MPLNTSLLRAAVAQAAVLVAREDTDHPLLVKVLAAVAVPSQP
jgi:hypothetical protein